MRRLLRPAGPRKVLRRRGTDLPPDPGEIVGLGSVSKNTIYPHVFENADREVGGVLVGRTPSDGGAPMITGAIPAISADERRATLTFTQDAWAHVHHTLDTGFPADEQIVGWYHSHPGFGIFLSGHDLFIHRNFFGAPSQIAVVVDPIARTEGAFAWREEELVCLYEQPTPAGWQAPPPELLDSVEEQNSGGLSLPPVLPVDASRSEDTRDRLLTIAGGATAAVILALVLAFVLGAAGGNSKSRTTRPPASGSSRVGKSHARSGPAATGGRDGKRPIGRTGGRTATTTAVPLLPPATKDPRYPTEEPEEPANANTEVESRQGTPGASTGAPGGGTPAGPETGGASG